MAHRPPTPPTRRQRQRAHGANSHAPRLKPPSSAPLRSDWAAFMGDRAFARASAAGNNATEAGQARAKAEADIALSLPEEYRDEKNETTAECFIHAAQKAAERRWSNRCTNTYAARGL